MSMTISILGGVGLFLLGMTVMTSGLKTLAGPAMRSVLGKAAATPLRGAFWGAMVTLLVQSSSATIMTTIGLVSAGLLTFPQGLGLVLGANVGTTGTGWLIALIGVRVSLTAAALPMIFVGALIKLLGHGRVSAAGAALAGFALVLFGLTTLQQGMGGLAEQLHPADLPAVLGAPGVGWGSGSLAVIMLVGVGLVMTSVMQSSTAAIAVTLSAYFAGAVGLDQACALIIGQNIGTATSSAMAAIGASSTAKRLALAYILVKLIAAAIALVLFPLVIPLLTRASSTIDGVTLLAGYHTAYNVVGVAVVMPLMGKFTQFVERILPERGSPLTRCLDPSALATPIIAVEAVRRTVARTVVALCNSLDVRLASLSRGEALHRGKDVIPFSELTDALRQAQEFISGMDGPLESKDDQRRLTSTLHALHHASRLVETTGEEGGFETAIGDPGGVRAVKLCAEVMRSTALMAGAIIEPARADGQMASPELPEPPSDVSNTRVILQLEHWAKELGDVQRSHRSATLSAAAGGELTATEAMGRVDTVRRLAALAHHAWRTAAHLTGVGT